MLEEIAGNHINGGPTPIHGLRHKGMFGSLTKRSICLVEFMSNLWRNLEPDVMKYSLLSKKI